MALVAKYMYIRKLKPVHLLLRLCDAWSCSDCFDHFDHHADRHDYTVFTPRAGGTPTREGREVESVCVSERKREVYT